MKELGLKIWNWISDFGVSQDHPEENLLVRSYNVMSVISALGVIPVILLAYWTDFPSIYLLSTVLVLSLYISVIICNYFEKIYLARYFISVGSPLWQNLLYIVFGGFYCQGAAIMASMAITYVAFQKKQKVKIGLLIYHVVLFFMTNFYVITYNPIFEVINFPYDELVVFIGSLGWAVIVLYAFDRERANLLEDLKTNNKELRNTTEELERFTYIASHDLKSPLRTIISFIGLIERDVTKENYDNLTRNLNFVKSGALQMNFLVQDILELSTLNNLEEKERSLIDLNIIEEKARHNLLNEIEEKNAIIHCEKLPRFLCNDLEFLLLFQNFIQNGIKYNESEQPTVSISSFETDKKLHLSFQDNGIGIDKKYFSKLFKMFSRLHSDKDYEGTGLGLSLCKKIVYNMGGNISIDSELGKGSTFHVNIPRDLFVEKEEIKQLLNTV